MEIFIFLYYTEKLFCVKKTIESKIKASTVYEMIPFKALKIYKSYFVSKHGNDDKKFQNIYSGTVFEIL